MAQLKFYHPLEVRKANMISFFQGMFTGAVLMFVVLWTVGWMLGL